TCNIKCVDRLRLLFLYVSLFLVFFFFQAEDGIRDYKVTGVQTCALPIYWRSSRSDPCKQAACRAATFFPGPQQVPPDQAWPLPVKMPTARSIPDTDAPAERDPAPSRGVTRSFWPATPRSWRWGDPAGSRRNISPLFDAPFRG